MNEENYRQPYYQAPRRSRPTNLFTVLAATFAFLALFMVMTGILAVFFGSLALLFAILSKGRNDRMEATALLAAWVSTFAMVSGAGLTAYSAYTLLHDEASRTRFFSTMDALYDSINTGDMDRYMEILSDYYQEAPAGNTPATTGGNEL